MQEPILEALTFACQGVKISDGMEHNPSISSEISEHLEKALQHFNRQTTTRCPFKSCSFELLGLTDPLCETFHITQEFLKHLLVEHNLVIDNVAEIANLHRYLTCLGEIFGTENFKMEDYCVAFWMDQPITSVEAMSKDTLSDERRQENVGSEIRHKYFMVTPVVPEDSALRAQLWSERLESVLEINRLEREQKDFSYKCPLFCKEVCHGNRANLFLHMAQEHAFHVGQPDNIVFVKDFLTQIESQLEELKCIYCEKTFKDRITLKEHMRKKLHKRINPLNPEYDRFYMVNYLEVGKTWQALQDEDVEEERIEEDWVELKDETNQIVCLICPEQLNSFEETLQHMLKSHNFDFTAITAKYDFYQKVKIVNFIRRNVYQNTCFYCESKLTDKKAVVIHLNEHHSDISQLPNLNNWDQSEYLFPTYENDQFLMFLDENVDLPESDKMDTDGKGHGPTIIPEDLSDIAVPPRVQLPEDIDLDLF